MWQGWDRALERRRELHGCEILGEWSNISAPRHAHREMEITRKLPCRVWG